jgi:hypothetical protein
VRKASEPSEAFSFQGTGLQFSAVRPHAGTCAGRTNMSTRSNAAISHACSRSYRTDMCSTLRSVMADPRAATRDRANMCAGTHAMCADMGANAHAEYINTATDILGAGRSSSRDAYGENKSKKGFHGVLRDDVPL